MLTRKWFPIAPSTTESHRAGLCSTLIILELRFLSSGRLRTIIHEMIPSTIGVQTGRLITFSTHSVMSAEAASC